MNFNFGEVLTKAWQIIWKHKVLWIFGILASCGQGSGGGNSGGGGNTGFDVQNPNLPPQVMQWIQTIEQNIQTYVAIGIALICVIWIITVFLSTIGRIGLIRGTSQADENDESLIFGQLFSESTPYFWRVLGLTIIQGLPVFIFSLAIAIFVLFAIVGIAGSGSGNESLAVLGIIPLMIGCLCLLIPVMFVVRMIFRQADRAVVLEDMAVLPSISRGWDIFRANLGPIVVLTIILAIIGFAVGIVIALPILLIVVPAGMAFALGNGQGPMPWAFVSLCFCLYIPVLLLLNGIVTAYIEAAWTLTYMQLTKPRDNTPVVLEANA